MSQIIQKLDQQQLKSLCGIVAHTSEGLTKSELTTLLGQCRICSVDDGSSRNQLGYTIGLNKRDWLYNCLVAEINKSQSFSKVFSFLQAVLNPAAYTSADSRQKYRHLLEETNKILLFAGLSIDQSGRLVVVSQAETLTEVDLRVNHLKKALYDRAIHSEVQKYCIEDYLRADYYDAVFEAAKGFGYIHFNPIFQEQFIGGIFFCKDNRGIIQAANLIFVQRTNSFYYICNFLLQTHCQHSLMEIGELK